MVDIAGRPMLAWSLEALVGADAVVELVIAAPAGHQQEVEEVVSSLAGAQAAVRVVGGGETRAESVARAIEGIEGGYFEVVVVHDAARPLIRAADVEMLVAELGGRPDADGVIAASPLADTVKRAREPRPANGEFPRGGPTVAKTESREHLWRAETPQVFRRAVLKQAIKGAGPRRLRQATDESFLVEKAGGKVLIREVSGPNLKVTTRADLELAEHLLRTRKR